MGLEADKDSFQKTQARASPQKPHRNLFCCEKDPWALERDSASGSEVQPLTDLGTPVQEYILNDEYSYSPCRSTLSLNQGSVSSA